MQNVDMKKHLDLLGHRVREKISGAEGVVTSVSFDLFGCVQAIVDSGFKKDGDERKAHWFDISRLERLDIDTPRVMEPPYFTLPGTPERATAAREGRHGPADKPLL